MEVDPAQDARFVAGDETEDTHTRRVPRAVVTEFVIGDEFGPLLSGVMIEIPAAS